MASTLDTDAIAARLKNATPGPWGRMNDGPYMGTKPWTAYDEAAPGLTLASPANTEPICRVSGYCQPVEANADFIAAAPGDIAALLAEVARLTTENDALRGDLAQHVAGTATIESLTAKYGTMDAALGGHIVAALAEMMVMWFDEAGGDNYVEVKLRDRKSAKAPREFVLTVQRASGKTPHELREEALAEVATLREALKPFARLADRFDPALPDDDVLASIPAIQFALYDVTRGDLRRARRVL